MFSRRNEGDIFSRLLRQSVAEISGQTRMGKQNGTRPVRRPGLQHQDPGIVVSYSIFDRT
jgi:hypothetical protein